MATAIRPNVPVHVLRYAQAHGIDTSNWLAGLGMTHEQLQDPQLRLSLRQVRTILVRAMKACDEPGLGLLVGRTESVGAFGLLGFLMSTAATFGEAVRLAVANHEISSAMLGMSLDDSDPDFLAWVIWPRFEDPELQPLVCEELLASAIAVARQLVGQRFAPARVELTYRAPAHAALYSRVLGAETRFDAPANRVLVARRWLEVPMPGHDPLASRQAQALCRRQRGDASVTPQHELVASVRRILRTRCSRSPGMREVAEALHLGERSLRRQLAAAGCSFRGIHDQVRLDRALELLRGSRMPMGDVATAVGFSDAREFRRAFKRWTGKAPSSARASVTIA